MAGEAGGVWAEMRAAPKAWEKAQAAKLDNAILDAGAEHTLGALKLAPWNLKAGLRRVVHVDKPHVVAGVLGVCVCACVDDGLLAGLLEVAQREH